MNTITLITEYAAAPSADNFKPTTLSHLREIQAGMAASVAADEWNAEALESDRECVAAAIKAAEAGISVLVALDEDGYFFATQQPRAKRRTKGHVMRYLLVKDGIPVAVTDGAQYAHFGRLRSRSEHGEHIPWRSVDHVFPIAGVCSISRCLTLREYHEMRESLGWLPQPFEGNEQKWAAEHAACD